MTRINELHQQMTAAITAGNWVLAMEIRRTVLKMSIEAKG
jgi:hypothetical protein